MISYDKEMRLRFDEARSKLGYKGRYRSSRHKDQFRAFHPGTNFVWAGDTLEQTLRSMYEDWIASLESTVAGVSPITLMMLSCAKAFGMDRRDVSSDMRHAVVHRPRCYAAALLRRLGFRRAHVGQGFNRDPESIRGMERFMPYFYWLTEQEVLRVTQIINGREAHAAPKAKRRRVGSSASDRRASP